MRSPSSVVVTSRSNRVVASPWAPLRVRTRSTSSRHSCSATVGKSDPSVSSAIALMLASHCVPRPRRRNCVPRPRRPRATAPSLALGRSQVAPALALARTCRHAHVIAGGRSSAWTTTRRCVGRVSATYSARSPPCTVAVGDARRLDDDNAVELESLGDADRHDRDVVVQAGSRRPAVLDASGVEGSRDLRRPARRPR